MTDTPPADPATETASDANAGGGHEQRSSLMAFAALLLVMGLVGAGVGVAIGWVTTTGSGAGSPVVPPVAPQQTSAGGETESGDAGNPYAAFRFVDFDLTDQDGAARDQALLEGEVTAVSFFFTSCPGPCPAITRVLSRFQGETADAGARIMSVSVDGGHDTPERIRAYGQGFDADFDRWTFLTGEPEDVARLARESLTYTMRDAEDDVIARADGSRIANILHPTRIALVGPDRRVIGLYAYDDETQVEALIADAIAARQ